MKRINRTKFSILGFLTVKPMSGYDIKKFIDTSITFFWSENFGRLYPTLNELEKAKLITKQVKHHESRPSKNIYTITAAGRKELVEWLSLPAEPEKNRYELLLKLFFGKLISKENIIEKIEMAKKRHEELLNVYQGIEKHLDEEELNNSEEKLFWKITLSNGKHTSKAQINWCNETLALMQSYKNEESL